jgi:hypothetical protein
MIKGYVVNNTGRSRHIFQRTVYPGGKVQLEDVYKLLGPKVTEGARFEDWLKGSLPKGWELTVPQPEVADATGGRMYKETLTAEPTVAASSPATEPTPFETDAVSSENQAPSKEYLTPRQVSKMTAKDIYDLRIKDNPKRILKNVSSIHKLRRALTLCKNDNRKVVLLRLIQGRIRELNVTL